MSGLDLKNHHALTSAEQVNQICMPLNDLGITYFNYIKIFHRDSSRELLTNNAPWIETFYDQALYKSVGAIDIEHLLPKGYFLWSELDASDPIYAIGRESFNIDNGVSFVEKHKDFTLLYIFASNRENYKINNFYIRNSDLFKRFIYFFNEQAASLIQEASKNRIYLPTRQEINANRLNTYKISEQERVNFFNKTNISKYYLLAGKKDCYLTKKQAECAFYLASGLTSKECAKALNISFRTVEEYIVNIKEKIYIMTGNKVSHKEMITYLNMKSFQSIVFTEKSI